MHTIMMRAVMCRERQLFMLYPLERAPERQTERENRPSDRNCRVFFTDQDTVDFVICGLFVLLVAHATQSQSAHNWSNSVQSNSSLRTGQRFGSKFTHPAPLIIATKTSSVHSLREAQSSGVLGRWGTGSSFQ